MSRIAGQQDPSVAVPFSLPGLKPVARQPGHFSRGKIRAEHAADAVLELRQGHRRVIADFGGLVFGGLNEQNPVRERPEREYTAVCPGETRADPAQPGDVEVAVVQLGHRIGQGDLGQPVDLWISGAGNGIPAVSRTLLRAPTPGRTRTAVTCAATVRTGVRPASAGLDVLRRSSWSSRGTNRRNRCPTVDA